MVVCHDIRDGTGYEGTESWGNNMQQKFLSGQILGSQNGQKISFISSSHIQWDKGPKHPETHPNIFYVIIQPHLSFSLIPSIHFASDQLSNKLARIIYVVVFIKMVNYLHALPKMLPSICQSPIHSALPPKGPTSVRVCCLDDFAGLQYTSD